jgi:hypothetical protein
MSYNAPNLYQYILKWDKILSFIIYKLFSTIHLNWFSYMRVCMVRVLLISFTIDVVVVVIVVVVLLLLLFGVYVYVLVGHLMNLGVNPVSGDLVYCVSTFLLGFYFIYFVLFFL